MSTEIIINQDIVEVNVTEEIITIEVSGAYPLPSTVSSVFGRTGSIVATIGDYNTSLVTENTNLYFTNARARTAISLTTTGTSGAATYDNATGIFNIPQYQGGVTSFNTRTGAITLLSADITTALGYTPVTNARTLTINGTTYDLTADRSWTIATGSGTVTSVGLSAPTGFSVTNSPITTSGTLALGFASGYSLPTNVKQSNWDDAYTFVAAFPTQTGNAGKYLTTDGSVLSWATNPLGTVTSVAVTESGDALTITGSPITTSGTINIGFAGIASQYVRGDGTLANFPSSRGGGNSVAYYFNSSVSQGTLGGVAYRELSKVPIIGTGTDITIATNGYIANYITDAGDPALLEIPAGNWNFEVYFSASSGGGSPSFYVELYKYDGTTFTLISSSSATPEGITGGTAIDLYTTALAVPTTALTLTDRLAIRVYVTHSGRTITLHTENSHLCEVITTFSSGISALNSLTNQVQYLATGTTGTDFNISSTTDTHTFNLPTASGTNTGKLSSSDWTTFNNKANALSGTINTIAYWDSATTIASLALATYPSLTELSYVKGVTSAIQTQLNGKQGTLTLTTTGTSGAATLIGNTLNIPQYSGGGGSITLAAIGSTPNANAATLTGSVLNLEPASASFGGVVTTGTQTFAGAKTFSSDLTISGVLIQTITTNRQTASYTLVLADRGKLVEMNVASANNLTIPLNSSVAFPIGTQIDLSQYGAGQTTIVATSGVTIRSTNNWVKLNARYGAATLIKIGTDEWYLFGNLNA